MMYSPPLSFVVSAWGHRIRWSRNIEHGKWRVSSVLTHVLSVITPSLAHTPQLIQQGWREIMQNCFTKIAWNGYLNDCCDAKQHWWPTFRQCWEITLGLWYANMPSVVHLASTKDADEYTCTCTSAVLSSVCVIIILLRVQTSHIIRDDTSHFTHPHPRPLARLWHWIYLEY